jgi:ubiquinol-cytochrome c reductase cytochrome b subunit
VHVLLLPGILLALVGVHLALVWYQKHTQFPGVPRTERNEVGVRILPVFAVKSGAFFVGVVAVLGLLGGLLQINAAHVSAGSQPDW